ncbi:hypothetical protein COJ96_23855 [Bacillus sp. AFS073361]|uniref:hypothetical protein n=1 Tax=Bacillus sp. AFS073361 TaxID=2033511 RepID=UPI000BF7A515|nr:hypothetical protein [Bacillus sp. AFS073361]PFP23518.1 hypothetical protein COJ96_23855 [Bacillus sp. AFS073361]
MFFLPTTINIKGIKLNNVDHLSSVSLNSTMIQNKNVSAKKNQGIGQQFADGTIRAFTVSSTIDNEIKDSMSQKNKNA